MPISDQYQCIFVHIPKCAGTSIEFVLGMHGENTEVGIKPFDSNNYDGGNLFGKIQQHYTVSQIKAVIDCNRFNCYYKFSFTRNPWDRLVSFVAWRGAKWAREEALQNTEFRPFVLDMHKRWKRGESLGRLEPQVSYLTDPNGRLLVDFLGKVECIERDWDTVRASLGQGLPDLPERMRSTHAHYSSYYDNELRDICSEIYAEDVNQFGYTFSEG